MSSYDGKKISWKCKRNQLVGLIQKVSSLWGGIDKDKEWLELYIQDVLKDWNHDLDKAIFTFQELVNQKESLDGTEETVQ